MFQHEIKSISKLTTLSRRQVIMLHCLLWICFLFFPLLIYRIDFFNKQFFTRDLVNNAFLIGLFYVNYYYLLPRYFNGRRITLYFVIVLVCIVVFILQQMYVEYLFMHLQTGSPFFTPGFEMHRNGFDTMHRPPFQTFQHNEKDAYFFKPGANTSYDFFSMPAMFWIGGVRRSLSGILSILLAGSFARVAVQWLRSEKQKEELQIQRLNDELGLLKAQINPHFLFNSLNSVYALARKNSPYTEEFILKLSDILRYVIYESSAQKMQLAKELTYIKNYIELQKYRIGKGMQIIYECVGEPGNLSIEPMLLITFIENACKYGISYEEGSFINIRIDIEESWLSLHVKNTYNQQSQPDQKGIGLQNVKKRLQLLYPLQHELVIADYEKVYDVKLKIKLSDD